MKAWFPILGLTLAGFGASQANAQTWPTGTVTFIVGFAAGGSSDIAARVIAQQLASRIGQTVVVDNRPGASGVIGYGAAARAKPDGQSFLFGSGSLASGPSLMKSLPYDTASDFVPVSQITTIAKRPAQAGRGENP